MRGHAARRMQDGEKNFSVQEQNAGRTTLPMPAFEYFLIRGLQMMKWYHEWKLSRVRAEIAALETETGMRLRDDYTGQSRLRVLRRLAASLEARLAKYSSRTDGMKVEEAH
jgi:hypothetical protein